MMENEFDETMEREYDTFKDKFEQDEKYNLLDDKVGKNEIKDIKAKK